MQVNSHNQKSKNSSFVIGFLLQFTDKNPVVCPANWTPGQDTIIPDPTKKLEYFTKVNKNEL